MAKKKINKVEAMVEAFAEYEEKRNIPKEAVIEALRISTQNAFNRVVVDEEKG